MCACVRARARARVKWLISFHVFAHSNEPFFYCCCCCCVCGVWVCTGNNYWWRHGRVSRREQISVISHWLDETVKHGTIYIYIYLLLSRWRAILRSILLPSAIHKSSSIDEGQQTGKMLIMAHSNTWQS